MMVAGTETTAHSLVSCLFFLKKYPDTLQKLRKELSEEGFVKGDKFVDSCTIDKLQKCTYLNCCVTENFRIDSVVGDSSEYEPSEDIKICGVPIPKGTNLRVDLIINHFNDSKWLDPYAFKPERHDVESEFYQKSKDAGKNPDVYTRRTFSHGMRKCPGQSLATLEMKVFIAYLVTHIEYEFEDKLIETEGVGFGIGSHFTPYIKVTQI